MGHHHGSDTPTSARAVLLHTDQKGPNILTGSVSDSDSDSFTHKYKKFAFKIRIMQIFLEFFTDF